ncbi:uncharacterized protein [Diadema setosum]|uniref:uncharacterized protein n=1 Tax=Diadema setosum TaxID=31175 RepID=UPI003B3A6AED
MGLSSAFLNLRTFELLYEYFPDDFAFISGISVISMPIGEALAPALTERILTAYGLHWAVLINGALFLNMFPIGISLKTKSPSKGYEEPTTKSAEEESLLPRSGDHNGFVRNGSLRRGRSSSHGQSNHRSRSSSAEENAGYSLSSALTAVSKFTHLDVLAKEPIFTAFLLPSVSLTYLTICGWTFFVVVYALSEGIEISRGAFLLPAGALGGFLSSCIFCCILCWRESWCPYLYLGSLLLAAFGFFIQVLNSSYIYLLVTSFIIGFGLCGGNVTSEAMIAWLVEPENVPDACNPFLFVIGLAYLFSGYMTGFVQDRTHSTKKVFILLGSVLLAASLLGGVAVVIGRKKRTARQNQMRVS